MFAVRRPKRRTAMAGVALAVSVALVGQIAAQAGGRSGDGAAPGRRSAPDVPRPVSVDVVALKGKDQSVGALHAPGARPVHWPKPGRHIGSVPDAKAKNFTRVDDSVFSVGDPRSRQAASLATAAPSTVETPDTVVVETADQSAAEALGLAGVIAKVTAPAGQTPGQVALTLNYADFADAYGGDWSSRLRFVLLPDCALTTPELAECREGTALASHNDSTADTLTAVVDLTAQPTTASAPGEGPASSPLPQGDPAAEVADPVPSGASRPAPTDEPSAAPTATTAPVTHLNGTAVQLMSLSSNLTNPDGSTVTVAATSLPEGVGGDWGATPLSESSTWSAGGSSGAASWSYPIEVPSVAGGLVPNLAIDYNSGYVDGRTTSKNNQSSWIGEGFDLAPGYVERRYVTCADDNAPYKKADGTNGPDPNNTVHKTGDLCWRSNNAVLNLAGSTDELVEKNGVWYKRFDDGTRARLLIGDADNGTQGREYWEITTPDGTRYRFGQGKVGAHSTNSAWTVPVFGNHLGEPGYKADFKQSGVNDTIWRWNLDQVVDVHTNAIVYTWDEERNKYSPYTDQNAAALEYTRGGTLAQIDYGMRGNNTAAGSARVSFTTGQRCTVGATECAESAFAANKAYWWDVPGDLVCTVSPCGDKYTPTFFSQKRLVRITTEVRDDAGTGGYLDVNTWDIAHAFDTYAGNTKTRTLWPTSITRKARYGTDVALPPVQLEPIWLQNRVNAGPDIVEQIWKPRLKVVLNGTGGKVWFSYDTVNVCNSGTTLDADDNVQKCFPVRYAAPGSVQPPQWHWFHKYVVDFVDTTDNATASKARRTDYSYTGSPAWAYDSSVLTPKKDRTWNQWRGYEVVTTEVGDKGPSDPTPLKTVSTYYRGLYGTKDDQGPDPEDSPDTLVGDDPDAPGPNTRTDMVISRKITGSTAGTAPDSTVKDYARFQGRVRQTLTYNGSNLVSVVVTEPWQDPTSTASAPRTLGGSVSRRAGVAAVHTFTAQTQLPGESGASTWRHTRVRNTIHDSLGYIEQSIDDGLVDDSASDQSADHGGDAVCTTTQYNARGGPRGILDRIAKVTVRAGSCSNGKLLSEVKNYYDDDQDPEEHAEAVDKGLLTKTSAAKGATGSSWGVTSITTYDDWGRIKETTDADSHKTVTSWTHNTFGRPIAVKVDAPDPDPTKPIQISAELHPVHGVTTLQIEPSGRRTTATYDALGRTIAVWKDGRTGGDADLAYTYELHGIGGRTGPNAITTTTRLQDADNPNATNVDGTERQGRFVRSMQLLDGFMRPRQTQTELLPDDQYPNGGRLITLTEYDSRGLVVAQHGPAFNEEVASTVLAGFIAGNPAPGTTRTTLDGAGRPIASTFTAAKAVTGTTDLQLTTSYLYGGYWTKVTPPQGEAPRTTVTDARGQTVRLIEHGGSAGDRTTTYSWDAGGQPAGMVDGAGNTWAWEYDVRGNRIKTSDPDTGITTSEYDDLDQLVKTTDARNQVLVTAYDAIGRPTSLREGSSTGPQLTQWEYDAVKPGLPSATVRTLRDPAGTSSKDMTTRIAAYDAGDRPTETITTIPALPGVIEEDMLGGPTANLTTKLQYNDDGSLASTEQSAFGANQSDGKPLIRGEKLLYGYDSNGRPEFFTGAGSYISDVLRAPTGEALRYGFGNSFGQAAWLRFAFQPGTRRLTDMWLDRESKAMTDVHSRWRYDNAGNPEQKTTWREATDTSATPSETECFDYDGLRQLIAAWTPSTHACNDSEAGTVGLGGPAPYSTVWTFDRDHTTGAATGAPIGNRSTETTRSGWNGTGPTATTSSKYFYLGGDSHRLQRVETTATGSGRAGTDAYTYDAAGNTLTSNINAAVSPANQTLAWNAEGKLANVTVGSTTVEANWYDAAGTRIVRRDAESTTLYLGNTELVRATNGTLTWRRYYDFDGRTIAVRDGNAMTDVQIQITDPHNTGTWSTEAGTGTLRHRPTTPYGALRGNEDTQWANLRGFVGGTRDPGTGLTLIGARHYSPLTGRFVSADPLLDLANPSQHHGYAYASNNPLAFSDPSGLLESGNDPYAGLPEPACGWDFDCGYGAHVSHPDDSDTPVNQPPARGSTSNGGGSGAAQAAGCGVYAGLCQANNFATSVGSGAGRAGGWVGDTFVWGDPINCVDHGDALACLFSVPVVGKAGSVVKGGKDLFRRLFGGGGGASKVDEVPVSALCSFSAATGVLMADGTTKPISEIEVGDEVLAEDPETGERGPRKVTALWVHEDSMVDLDVDGRVLTTTEDHPFWNATDQQWQQAKDLDAGDTLLTADGHLVPVRGIRPDTGAGGNAYNLTVDDIHTYYVVASGADRADGAIAGSAILVHNICVDDVPGVKHSLDGHKRGGPDWEEGNSWWHGGIDQRAVGRYADMTEGQIGRYSARHGTVQHEINTHEFVGYDSAGRETTWVTVARDPNDNALVTIFPGKDAKF